MVMHTQNKFFYFNSCNKFKFTLLERRPFQQFNGSIRISDNEVGSVGGYQSFGNLSCSKIDSR